MLSAGYYLLLQNWLDPKLLMYCVLKNLKTDMKYGSITEAKMQRQWTKLIIEPIFSFPGTAFPLLIFRALSLPFLSHKVPFTPSSSIKYFSFPGAAALDEQKGRLKELFGVEFLRANEQEKWSEEDQSPSTAPFSHRL